MIVPAFTVPTPATSKLSIRTAKEIAAMEFDDSDLILGDRYLAEGAPMSLCGQGGVGKSRLVTQLAVCQRLGIPFGKLPTHGRARKWLFLQTENNLRRQKFELQCLRAWVEKKYPGRWAMVEEGLVFHTLETDDDGMLQVEIAGPSIAEAIGEHKPDIPVFDPLKDFTTGSLDKDEDMLRVAHMLTRMAKEGDPNRAPLFLHHSLTGKAGAAKAVGYDRSSFGRNSKALMATVRAQMNVVPYDENNNERLVISSGKNNNGREFEPFVMELNTLPGTEGYMIYELLPDIDLEAWREGLGGGKKEEPLCTPEMLPDFFDDDGSGLEKIGLARRAMRETGVSQATGFRLVERALKKKLLHYSKVEKRVFPLSTK